MFKTREQLLKIAQHISNNYTKKIKFALIDNYQI
jgi:hypothetical protein